MIEFSFEKVSSEKFGEVLKPVIPVTIIGMKRKVNVFMLLDSGADISMIPYSVGEAIGIEFDLSMRGEVCGIGEGSVPYVVSKVRFRIKDIEIPSRIGWALIEEVPLILGRLDVFQKFAIEFREFENKIFLKSPL
ncbi:MAG: aspartyl protease family protein [bacterium]